MTLPAVGASVWASGNQVWKGKLGTLKAKPRKKPQKARLVSSSALLRRQIHKRLGRRRLPMMSKVPVAK